MLAYRKVGTKGHGGRGAFLDDFQQFMTDSRTVNVSKNVGADVFALSDIRVQGKSLTDTVVLSDAISKGPNKSTADIVSLSDIVAKDSGKSLGDSITVSDSVTARDIIRGLVDSFALDDLFSRIWVTSAAFAELINLAETVAKGTMKYAQDSINITDPGIVAGLDYTYSSADFSLSDVVTKSPSKSLAELIGLVEAIAKGAAKYVLDNVSITEFFDAQRGAGGFTLNVDDTIVLAESFLKAVGKALGDAVDVSDTITRATGKFIADTISLLDVFARTLESVRTFADTVAVDDIVLHGPGKALGETVDLSDSRRMDMMRSLLDAIATDDTIQRAPLKLTADSITLIDSFSRIWFANLSLTDAFAIDDAVVKALERTLADSLLVLDALNRGIGRSYADTLAVDDLLSRGSGKVLADSISLVDQFSRLLEIVRTFVDIFALSDTISAQIPGKLNVTDTIALTDVVSKDIALAAKLDSAVVADLLQKGAAVPFVEAIVLDDLIIRSMQKPLVDSIILVDVYARVWDAVRSFQEAITLSDSKRFDISRSFGETIDLADFYLRSIGHPLLDVYGVGDIIVRNIGLRRFTESFALDDSLGTAVPRSASFLELIAITDSVVRQAAKYPGEVFVLSDVFDRRWDAVRLFTEVFALLDLFSYVKPIRLVRGVGQLNMRAANTKSSTSRANSSGDSNLRSGSTGKDIIT